MSERIDGLLTITLKSDLCVSSGYSYAGIIDSDICYEKCGLPYIPGKRIKGCLRETMEAVLLGSMCTDEDILGLFGDGGNRYSGSLIVENAYLNNHEQIGEELLSLVGVPERVLDQFTHVVGQTKMEDGIADAQSLRYTRVVNHFTPTDVNKEMCFIAKISCEEMLWDKLKMAVAGTRHIGLKRNRGMGNVFCTLEKTEAQYAERTSFIRESKEPDGRFRLDYAIQNKAPLMMTGRLEDDSETFISGRSVLGNMASRYIANEKPIYTDENKIDYTDEFRSLFLDGTTVFSNLYPVSDEYVLYPAPEYINRLKKTGVYVNTLSKKKLEEAYNNEFSDDAYVPLYGNQPKKLKGKFVKVEGNTIKTAEVKKDVIYHNSRRKKNESGDDGFLYSQEVIREGQIFAGFIIVPENLKGLVMELLLSDPVFRFGRSKSSQYSRAELVDASRLDTEDEFVKDGKHLLVTFISDTLLSDTKGTPTVKLDSVVESLKEELGLPPDTKLDDDYNSYLQTTLRSGYMTEWNMRRDSVPMVRAGSGLVFQTDAKVRMGVYFIGERNAEGYGQIRVEYIDDVDYRMESIPEKEKILERRLSDDTISLYRKICMDKWIESVKVDYLSQRNKGLSGSNTANGRILRMLSDCINEEADNVKRFALFKAKINSIKKDESKKYGNKIIKLIEDAIPIEGPKIDAFEKIEHNNYLKSIRDVGISEENIYEYMKSMWIEYAKMILVNRKYEGIDR